MPAPLVPSTVRAALHRVAVPAGVTVLRDAALSEMLMRKVIPTVLAFHWMNVYQPRVSASRAALIYLLEPVFAALFSLAWGHDRVSLPLVAGGGLILGGNLLVELPGWLRERIEGPDGATGRPAVSTSISSGTHAEHKERRIPDFALALSQPQSCDGYAALRIGVESL